MQQRAAHLFFQAPDLVAHGRLREMQALGGTREAAGFLDGHEGAQQCGSKSMASDK